MKDAAQSKRKQTILIICISLAVVAAVVVCFILTRSREPVTDELPTETIGRVIDEANVQDIIRDVEEKVDKGMFETYMNTTWTFPNGKSASTDAVMGNPATNHYDIVFSVALADTGETVFSSGVLPLGKQMGDIILDTELEAGTYPAMVSIQNVDENGELTEVNMAINITLVIKK